MPRSPSGIYTLPVASFVSGTVIKSADMNSDLGDIATALTQSLASNGVTAMTAPLPAFGGTVTVPGYTFAGDTNTGIYQVTGDILGVAAGGIQAASFDGVNGINASLGINFSGTVYSFSTAAANSFLTALAENTTLLFTIDGGGSVPTTGVKGFLEVPCNLTVKRWTIFADQSGSAVVDITMSSFAAFPPSSSITGTDKPTISSAQSAQGSLLTGWTTALPGGNFLGYNLTSVTTCTRVQVSLLCTRTSR